MLLRLFKKALVASMNTFDCNGLAKRFRVYSKNLANCLVNKVSRASSKDINTKPGGRQPYL